MDPNPFPRPPPTAPSHFSSLGSVGEPFQYPTPTNPLVDFKNKLKKSLKKNKPLRKLFKKSPDSNAILTSAFEQLDFQKTLLDLTNKIEEKYICPLTNQIIKKSNRVFGLYYEATAIKEYVLKYNRVPDGTPVNFSTLSRDDTTLRAVLQPDVPFDKEIQKYTKTKVENFISILATHANYLKENQVKLVDATSTLMAYLRPSEEHKELGSLIEVLEDYPEMFHKVVAKLFDFWGEDTIKEFEILRDFASRQSAGRIVASLSGYLAAKLISAGNTSVALDIYKSLYKEGLASHEDLKNMAELFILHYWSDDILTQYNSPEFTAALHIASKRLNKSEIILSLSMNLYVEATELTEKAKYLSEILESNFNFGPAKDAMLTLADEIASTPACKEYYSILTRVLIEQGKHKLLAEHYSDLKPREELMRSKDFSLLEQIEAELDQQGDKGYVIEVENLRADLLFEDNEFEASAALTQNILDLLDSDNSEAFQRLRSISIELNQPSLLAKYSIKTILEQLVGPEKVEEKEYAVSVISDLLVSFESKIEKAGANLPSSSIEPELNEFKEETNRRINELVGNFSSIQRTLKEEKKSESPAKELEDSFRKQIDDVKRQFSEYKAETDTLKQHLTENSRAMEDRFKKLQNDTIEKLKESQARLKQELGWSQRIESQMNSLRIDIDELKKYGVEVQSQAKPDSNDERLNHLQIQINEIVAHLHLQFQ